MRLAAAVVPAAVLVACAAPVYAAPQLADLLARVRVVASIPDVPGYDRDCKKGHACSFGPAWHDPSHHDSCNSRDRVLAHDLQGITFKPGTKDCKVITGTEVDPYTGRQIALAQTQIDHIYPLHRAWSADASHWPLDKRIRLANDYDNLIAVSGSANESKGDRGPGTWLPPNVSYRCAYVIRYLTVAAKPDYQLPIDAADKAAALKACR